MSIEELVSAYPGAVKFFVERHLPCLVCGEPVWATIEEVALGRGYTSEQVDHLVDELNHSLHMRVNA